MAFLLKEGKKEGGREGRWVVGIEERREEADKYFFKAERGREGESHMDLATFFNAQNEKYLCLW